MLSFRLSHVAIALSSLFLVLWLTWSFNGKHHDTTTIGSKTPEGGKTHGLPDQPESEFTEEELQLNSGLADYGIANMTSGTVYQYARVELDLDPASLSELPLLQDIKASFPRFSTLKKTDIIESSSHKTARATVPAVSSTGSTDASNIVFGVATDLDRLNNSLHVFAHWAAGNGARIIAIVGDGNQAQNIKRTEERARMMNINLQIIGENMEFNDRYFSLTKFLYENRGDAQWAAFIDDDTFFPSIDALQHLLSKYDSNEPHFVGALSEDFYQIASWGIIAFGGAGIFVSMPLLHDIMPHYDACLATTPSTGDKRLTMCILTYTTVRMSHEPKLHQVDLIGDATGFYEALREQPVSVHHWKSWYHIDMAYASVVTKICGDACLFQKYRFTDDWQLTNGVSLIRYNHARDANDIRMEHTWDNSRGEDQEEMFRHTLAPLKPKDPGKVQYLLESAQYDEQKEQVRQFYVRRLPAEKKMEIIEIVWRKNPSVTEDRNEN